MVKTGGIEYDRFLGQIYVSKSQTYCTLYSMYVIPLHPFQLWQAQFYAEIQIIIIGTVCFTDLFQKAVTNVKCFLVMVINIMMLNCTYCLNI